MEIYFCDLCNESVPQGDLDKGRAFRRNDRVICATCDRAMSVHEVGAASALPGAGERAGRGAFAPGERTAVAPVQAAPSGGSGVLIGLVALIFSAGGFALLIDRIDEVRNEGESSARSLTMDVARVEREHDRLALGLDGQLLASEERINVKRDLRRGELEKEMEALQADLQDGSKRYAEVDAAISELRLAEVKSGTERDKLLARLSEQLQRLENEVRFHNDRLIELQENMRGLTTGGIAAVGPALDGGGDGDRAPAWSGLLADLAHKNSGIRLDTLYALAETRDARVIPHLVPMLQDVDLFVRMGTARILQDLDARDAVPNLIDALEDPESAVRESAMVALRAITHRNFRFEPVASLAERNKRVKSWRDWWKKDGEEFLGGGEKKP